MFQFTLTAGGDSHLFNSQLKQLSHVKENQK